MFKTVSVVALMLVLCVAGIKAQERPTYELHSMMIYNFLKYIQWPDDQNGGDFIIVVLGEDDVYNTLNTWYSSKPKGSKKIVVKKITSAEEISKCHLVYIGSKESNQLESLLPKIEQTSTLVITDRTGMAKKGSGINFKVVNNRLKFEMNQTALTEANLKVSSQLSAMAIMI